MKNDRAFLVLGLPRSRTAWLSSLLTLGEVFCYHDLTARCKTVDEVTRKVMQNPAPVCGNSDSGNLFILERFLEAMPDTKLIWIHRDPDEVTNSLAWAMGERCAKFRPSIERLFARQNQLRARHGGKVYLFDELDKEETAHSIWETVTEGMEFPVDHWEKVKTMRVAIHDEIMQAAYSGRHECANSEISNYVRTLLA